MTVRLAPSVVPLTRSRMRILPADTVRLSPDDVVFRQSAHAPLAAFIGLVAAAAAVFSAGWRQLLPWPVALGSGVSSCSSPW